ncbi:hypothetical protein KIL84_021461 [Mauremys mutica]|uniref:Uncharacterized protein n=1 Tax=Mauremys mutica TaxID=74926 RepID=A0A9D4ASY4_9SAUR|nr:hypothetical protein KIL84_021461 [Mauremys mutica]
MGLHPHPPHCIPPPSHPTLPPTPTHPSPVPLTALSTHPLHLPEPPPHVPHPCTPFTSIHCCTPIMSLYTLCILIHLSPSLPPLTPPCSRPWPLSLPILSPPPPSFPLQPTLLPSWLGDLGSPWKSA